MFRGEGSILFPRMNMHRTKTACIRTAARSDNGNCPMRSRIAETLTRHNPALLQLEISLELNQFIIQLPKMIQFLRKASWGRAFIYFFLSIDNTGHHFNWPLALQPFDKLQCRFLTI